MSERLRPPNEESIKLFNAFLLNDVDKKNTLSNSSPEVIEEALMMAASKSNLNFFNYFVEQIDADKVNQEVWFKIFKKTMNDGFRKETSYYEKIPTNMPYVKDYQEPKFLQTIPKIYSFDISDDFLIENNKDTPNYLSDYYKIKFTQASVLYNHLYPEDNIDTKLKSVLSKSINEESLYIVNNILNTFNAIDIHYNGEFHRMILKDHKEKIAYQKYLAKLLIPILTNKYQKKEWVGREFREIIKLATYLDWSNPEEEKIVSEIFKLDIVKEEIKEFHDSQNSDWIYHNLKSNNAPEDIVQIFRSLYHKDIIDGRYTNLFKKDRDYSRWGEWVDQVYSETGDHKAAADIFIRSMTECDKPHPMRIDQSIIEMAISNANEEDIITIAKSELNPKYSACLNNYNKIFEKLTNFYPDISSLEKIINERKPSPYITSKIEEYIIKKIDINNDNHNYLFLKYGKKIPNIEENKKIEKVKQIIKSSKLDEEKYSLLFDNYDKYADRDLDLMILDFLLEEKKDILIENPKLFFNIITVEHKCDIDPSYFKKIFKFLSFEFPESEEYFKSIHSMFCSDYVKYNHLFFNRIIEYRKLNPITKESVEKSLSNAYLLDSDKLEMLLVIKKYLTP